MALMASLGIQPKMMIEHRARQALRLARSFLEWELKDDAVETAAKGGRKDGERR